MSTQYGVQDLEELEEAVLDAWPAAEIEECAGFCLRASGGPSSRANSVAVLPGASSDADGLPARIEQAETFYRARGLPVRFEMSPAAVRIGLDDALAERGYAKVGEAAVMSGCPQEVLARTPRRLEVGLGITASAPWLEHAVHAGRFAESADIFLTMLRDLGSRCRFVTARDDSGAVLGTALGIRSEQRLGIHHSCITSGARYKVVGDSLVRGVAECAAADGAQELYLLVSDEDRPAQELYARASFAAAYRYHYRVSP